MAALGRALVALDTHRTQVHIGTASRLMLEGLRDVTPDGTEVGDASGERIVLVQGRVRASQPLDRVNEQTRHGNGSDLTQELYHFPLGLLILVHQMRYSLDDPATTPEQAAKRVSALWSPTCTSVFRSPTSGRSGSGSTCLSDWRPNTTRTGSVGFRRSNRSSRPSTSTRCCLGSRPRN